MAKKIKCMLVFGTRPEVIKLAPVALELRAQPDAFDCVLVSTGQHRDLSRQALAMFNLTADIDLDLMSDNQGVGEFFGRAIAALDKIMVEQKPDWVLVQGDTGTVLAGAIAAYYRKIRVAHVEAGLRSHDLMAPHPEEGNRQMVSRIASLHFPPTEASRKNLLNENIADSKILVTGNTVVDAVQWIVKNLPPATPPAGKTILTTIHRRESFGEALIGMLEAIRTLADDAVLDLNFILPVHPNPQVSQQVHRILGNHRRIKLVPPMDYTDLLHTMSQSWLVLTDSGGLQEEAPCFHVPVFVLRDCTERPEGIAAGVARLVGTNKNDIIRAVAAIAHDNADYRRMKAGQNPYGEGRTARLISARLLTESGNANA